MNTNKPLRTTNPNEPATNAVTRTAQEILAALEARDSAKVASYYAPDAVLATPGRPAVRGVEAVSKAIRNDMGDPNFKLSVSDGKTDVAASGDLAYRRVSLKSHVYEPPDQTGGERRGHCLDRLQEAGGRKLEGGGRLRGEGGLDL
jgi:ketosteroid isomerase-like protein